MRSPAHASVFKRIRRERVAGTARPSKVVNFKMLFKTIDMPHHQLLTGAAECAHFGMIGNQID
jgi:hypothetical protein